MNFKINDTVKITSCKSVNCKHFFAVGATGVVKAIQSNGTVLVTCNNMDQNVDPCDIILISTSQNTTNMNQLMKAAALKAAKELAIANNTFSTLELKLKLRKDEPSYYWIQTNVSAIMDEFAKNGLFTYTDNGTHRVYSDKNRVLPKVKVKATPKTAAKVATKPVVTAQTNGVKISRTKALDLMKNNKGHFFTVEFKKQDGTIRKLNGQYVKDQKNSGLGYVMMKESSKLKAKDKEPIRNVNLQTLRSLKIGGVLYKVA